MSVIKLQNSGSNLISSVDANSEKLSYRSSRCSCIDCDSLTCFAKRNKTVKEVCQCGVCKDLKNCLSLTPKTNEERKVDDPKENSQKKIIRETVTRETIESLKKVTETMYEFGNNENFKVITQRLSKNNKDNNKPMDFVNIEKTNKNTVKSKDTDNIKKTNKENCTQITITQRPSSDELPQGNDNTATKLSAQVMNVPYKELHESTSSNQISEHNPLSKLNIFKRIKEIYDACSCKVCECISSKPFPLQDANLCQCKPCDCQDCTKLRKMYSNKRRPHSGCPCVRCDRKDCRGIVKNVAELQICDCKPCECIQCTENFPKSCNCEPCQCINCKALNSRVQKRVKLAKVDEVFHGETCKCSPCECIECKQIYNRTNPTVMWTTCTEMTRHRDCPCKNCISERCKLVEREACTCERCNNTMQRPFEKYNNYDIRTVIVKNNGPFEREKSIFQNHNTIAFFASLKNNQSQNISNKNICKCVDCECIACAAKEEALKRERDTLLRSNVRILQHSVTMPTPNMNACKCSQCECEICSQRNGHDIILMQSKCRCDICDCLNCDKASLPTCSKAPKNIVPPIKILDINNNCNCHPCECHNCKEFLSCANNVKFYNDGKSFGSKTVRRVRKVTLISPSSSAKYFNSQKICSSSVSSITLSPKKSIEPIYKQNIPTCHSTFQNDHVLLNQTKYYSNEHLNIYNQLYNDNNDFALDVDFNFQATKTSSCISVQDKPSFTSSNNFQLNTLKIHRITQDKTCDRTPDEISESKSKNLNVIHEKAINISNGSDESLPVLWTCSETINSRKLSSENTALTSCVDSNLKDSRTNIGKINRIGNVVNTQKMSTDDSFQRYTKYFHSDCISENIIFNNEHDVLHLQSQKYSDPFSTSHTKNANYKSPSINHLDLSTSYQRATTVLHEAKAFSAKLIKMLDSFEAANRNFKSASQKFKNLHMTLLDINETEIEKQYIGPLETHTGAYDHLTFENTIEHDPRQEEEPKNENEAEKEYEPSTSSTGHYNRSLNILDSKILEARNTFLKSDNVKMNISKNNVESINTISVSKQESNEKIIKEHIDVEELSEVHFRDNKDLNPKSLSSSGIDLNEANFSEKPIETQSNNVSNKDSTRISVLMMKLDSVFGKGTTVDAAIVTDDIETSKTDCLEQDERKQWNVLKKNLFLNTTPGEINRKMFGLSALEWNVKEAVHEISVNYPQQQDLQSHVPNTYEALTNLRSEVRSILNMPILQSNSEDRPKMVENQDACNLQQRGKIDLEHNSMSSTAASQTFDNVAKVDKEVYFNSDDNSKEKLNRCSKSYSFYRSYSPFNRRVKTPSLKNNETEDNQSCLKTRKSSCEDLKTSFAGLRRVSDHTLLVKWNLPKRLKDVQGYELLVDGRAVQKIFSPTRSIAVVTCLPNVDRVLLTIRTIATTTDCGHAPATNIVYRPRNK